MIGSSRIERIRRLLASGRFEFSRHAFRRAVGRNISEQEVRQAGEQAELIEDYPDDKYSSSCLVVGFTKAKRPLHLQVSVQESDEVKIITLYQPGEDEWDRSYSKRR